MPTPGAYLQRIARNLLYDRSKRAEARLASFHVPIGEGCEPAASPDQHHGIEAADVMRAYPPPFAEPPDPPRQVFLLPPLDALPSTELRSHPPPPHPHPP